MMQSVICDIIYGSCGGLAQLYEDFGLKPPIYLCGGLGLSHNEWSKKWFYKLLMELNGCLGPKFFPHYSRVSLPQLFQPLIRFYVPLFIPPKPVGPSVLYS